MLLNAVITRTSYIPSLFSSDLKNFFGTCFSKSNQVKNKFYLFLYLGFLRFVKVQEVVFVGYNSPYHNTKLTN